MKSKIVNLSDFANQMASITTAQLWYGSTKVATDKHKQAGMQVFQKKIPVFNGWLETLQSKVGFRGRSCFVIPGLVHKSKL